MCSVMRVPVVGFFFSLIWIGHLGYLNAGGKVCNVVCGGVPSLQEHQFCHLPRQCSY